MENHEINFTVFDMMIHHEPMKWQSIETDLKGNIFFLKNINNFVDNYPIHELVGDEIPEEYMFLFEECDTQELKEVRDELLSCLN